MINKKKRNEIIILAIMGLIIFCGTLSAIKIYTNENTTLENNFISKNNTTNTYKLIKNINEEKDFTNELNNLTYEQKIDFLIYQHYTFKNQLLINIIAIFGMILTILLEIPFFNLLLNNNTKKNKKRYKK